MTQPEPENVALTVMTTILWADPYVRKVSKARTLTDAQNTGDQPKWRVDPMMNLLKWPKENRRHLGGTNSPNHSPTNDDELQGVLVKLQDV